jgi:predicted AlkP superfamily phosphohydrolase/phosphomutase
VAERRSDAAHAIVFISDGMRFDLVERYVAAGDMPVLAGLMGRGAVAEGGCSPAVPANTGAGWATLATGAWSGTTGAINNVFHIAGTPITTMASGFDAALNVAETLAQAAERQGLTTASVEWPGTIPAVSRGPVIDYRTFYSTRGVVRTFAPPGLRTDLVHRLGLADETIRFGPAFGWSNVPRSVLPPRQSTVAVRSTRPQECPDRVFELLAYATTSAGYDRLLVALERDGQTAIGDLAPGQWAEVRVALHDGSRAGFHFKLIDLSPDLERVRLYFTSTSRPRAHPPELEELLSSAAFPVAETADHGPLEAGLVDAATYVEQGLTFYRNAERVYRHIVQTYRPDILFAGAPVTDEFSHQFLAAVTPAYPGFDPDSAPVYEEYLRQAYAGADRLLGFLVDLFPEDTLVAVCSDHGFGAAWRSVNANLALARAGLLEFDEGGRPRATSRGVAYWAGGTCNVYVNLAGREPGGVVPPADYEQVRGQVVDAFMRLDRYGDQGPVIAALYRGEETAVLETSGGPASMHFPDRTGDVVVFLAPPYQFDAPDPEQVVAPSPLLGQHGYLPDTRDARLNVEMRSPLVLSGPGVRSGARLRGARAIDLAPTVAHLLGLDPPRDAEGTVLQGALEK